MTALPTGILLPESVIHSDLFALLAAFVAIHTVFYATLALSKILPKVYLSDWVRRRHERTETRSINPEDPV
ncbi:hypothetical protein [Arthrobacter roseus]|uniref:hypothetical protein n=1 Tax=Arthrobacter roseus TaxID=136274 RepID=UPI001EF8F599|nr:hypothetical protein [Arthrobacter roseus]MBM7847098.1 hypothetical protein [Arthrobacter roseus]